jgi:hypothetical protein
MPPDPPNTDISRPITDDSTNPSTSTTPPAAPPSPSTAALLQVIDEADLEFKKMSQEFLSLKDVDGKKKRENLREEAEKRRKKAFKARQDSKEDRRSFEAKLKKRKREDALRLRRGLFGNDTEVEVEVPFMPAGAVV